MTTLLTPRRLTARRFVGIALLGVVSLSSAACTQQTPSSGNNSRPSATPSDPMVSAAFESARRLTHAVEGRQLTADPTMRASGGQLTTMRRQGSVDELVSPQVTITRGLEIAPDGTKTNNVNQIDIDATAPARKGRKLCHVTLTITFTQHSSLASSSDLTIETAAQGLQDTKNLQVQGVRVEPDLGVNNNALESSSLSTVIVTYNAEAGAFITSHPDHTEAPTTDQEFTQAVTLIRQVADCIAKAFDQDSASKGQGTSHAIDEDQLRGFGICIATCVITGRIPFQHPAWGASTLMTTLSLDQGYQETHIIVTDSTKDVRWRYDNPALNEQLAPASDTPDKAGNLFILYNPGRYDGIAVLRPTENGFDNLGTLPKPDDYNARFYHAKTLDANADGVLEIQKDTNDCNPSCGSGTTTSGLFSWNGTDYTQTQ